MLEIMSQYSGITAIIIYSALLAVFLNARKNKRRKDKENAVLEAAEEKKLLDPEDEDATVACLMASIEYRNETKKDVRIISVKEVES